MRKILAIFELTELDALTAGLHDLETKELLGRVEDDPDDRLSFRERVRNEAAQLGYEIAEWDRRALA